MTMPPLLFAAQVLLYFLTFGFAMTAFWWAKCGQYDRAAYCMAFAALVRPL